MKSDDHRSTEYKQLLNKEVETKKGGDREQYELLVLKKGLLLASALSSEVRMTRMSATGHQKAATFALWREGAYCKRRRRV